ncbi:hypothetical protein ACVBIO_03470 [Shewanella sp. 0m-8]
MDSKEIFVCAFTEILHLACKEFPASADIYPEKIAVDVEGYFKVHTEIKEAFDSFKEIYLNCIDTILFLDREGYLYFEKPEKDHFKATLTLKGLKALSQAPDLLEEHKSFKELFLVGTVGVSLKTLTKMVNAFLTV